MVVLSLVSDPCTLAQPQLQYGVVQSWPGSVTQPCSLELTPTCLLVSQFSVVSRDLPLHSLLHVTVWPSLSNVHTLSLTHSHASEKITAPSQGWFWD